MSIHPSPGLSARPLNSYEKLREYYRAWRWDYDSFQYLMWRLRYRLRRYLHPIQWRREQKSIQALCRALECGCYNGNQTPLLLGQPLTIESLQATMSVITYRDEDIKP